MPRKTFKFVPMVPKAEAAILDILDFQLKTTSGDVAYSTVESGTLENIGIAVVISSIVVFRQ